MCGRTCRKSTVPLANPREPSPGASLVLASLSTLEQGQPSVLPQSVPHRDPGDPLHAGVRVLECGGKGLRHLLGWDLVQS